MAKRLLKFITESQLSRVFSSQWLNHVSRGNALSAELFRMEISRLWLCLCNMASKTSCITSFAKQENLLLAQLGRDFPDVESKGYDSKTLAKKVKAWEEILITFNSQNPTGIKRGLSQLQECWRQLKLQLKKGACLKSS